jgi:hypothetical protein
MADQPQPPDAGTDPGAGSGGPTPPSDPPESPEYTLNDVVAMARDIVLYAPISLVLDAPELLPKMAEKGKQHMRNARALGPHALRKVQNRLLATAETVGESAAALFEQLGGPSGADGRAADGDAAADRQRDPSSPSSWSSSSAGADDRTTGSGGRTADVADPNENGARPATPPSPAVDELAIPDYDSLSALQVVDRLPGLTADELEAVRAYEAAHRGRKTILNKAAQLQA